MSMFDQSEENALTANMLPETLREYRKTRRESQIEFWSKFGVTQSRGSRFELGTEIPLPIAILLRLYFAGKISDFDLSQREF